MWIIEFCKIKYQYCRNSALNRIEQTNLMSPSPKIAGDAQGVVSCQEKCQCKCSFRQFLFVCLFVLMCIILKHAKIHARLCIHRRRNHRQDQQIVDPPRKTNQFSGIFFVLFNFNFRGARSVVTNLYTCLSLCPFYYFFT